MSKKGYGSVMRTGYNTRRNNRKKVVIGLVAAIVVVFAAAFALFRMDLFRPETSAKNNSATELSVKATASKSKAKAKKAATPAKPKDPDYIPPQPKDDGKSKGAKSGGLYVWNKSAFELFYGDSNLAERYGKLMNSAARKLGKGIQLYSMIIPTKTEFNLPSRLKNTKGGATTLSQADYMKAAYKKMNSNVKKINIYNALSTNCNDYLFFNTDHHWTGLGAYHAYEKFAEEAGFKPISLKDCTKKTVKGFKGSFTKMTNKKLKTDSVTYWQFPYSAPTTITDKNGKKTTYGSPYYQYAVGGAYTYSLFIYGDNPLTVIKSKSPSAKNEKILVVHDSFGNAFIPYLTSNYKEVYAVDFRSYKGTIKKLCDKHKITNVMFANGVMSSATTIQVDAMKKLLK